jgi:beta-glucosidase
MALIEKSARIAAVEASASGINWTFSPMVDIARDPRWGRIAEGSGEDPWLGSRVAEAMVKGYQGNDLAASNTIMACVKHFALYGAGEAGRDYNTVDMSRLSMFQNYLPPYKAALDAGAGSVMTSFNEVDGIPVTGNAWLLTQLLRKEWGFSGFVVTDYTSINEMTAHGLGDLKLVSALALKAGVDMDMVGEGFLNTLEQSLQNGQISAQQIDQACRRVLEAKYVLGLFDDPFRYLDEKRLTTDIFAAEHLAAAREIACRSFVLLKNQDQTLPLKKTGTIAVIGPLAQNQADMLGTWVIDGETERVVTVVDGFKQAVGGTADVLYAKGANITDDPYMSRRLRTIFGPPQEAQESGQTPEALLDEAIGIARQADVVVAVLGESAAMSGEAASRSDIGIPASQQKLLQNLVETGKPVVLVLINGRPLTLTWEDANVPAILEAWAPGHQAGNAIADVLFGDYNPSGKLTATFPRNVGQIPIYYNHKMTGRPMAEDNKFTSKYLDVPNDPLYPFGYGLSYATFEYGPVTLSKQNLQGNEALTASATVTNTDGKAGEEVVQLYIRDVVGSITRPVKELKGFKKIMLQAGEKQNVTFSITPEHLKFYNSQLEFVWEPGEFVIEIGTSSAKTNSATVTWTR